MNKKEFSKQGKKNRGIGARFELKVRAELENMGWIVSKWMNTVDYDKDGKIGKLISAKRKFNPFFKSLSIGVGFPDFIAFKKNDSNYDVIGVEAKSGGYLDQIEKGMCHWLLENKIFSRILIAKRSKERGKIAYIDFIKKYGLESNKA